MTKGKLADMMSKARFTEGEFYVQYRDFKEVVSLPIKEFEKIAEIVPQHRIARIIERILIPATSIGGTQVDIPIYESSDQDLLALPVVIRDTVDPETLRFVEMRDALSEKNR